MATSSPRPDRSDPGFDAAAASPGRSPWVVGIVIGFVLMVLVNCFFIYIAVSDADRIVPSYQLEHR
jgi:hypothetical protein